MFPVPYYLVVAFLDFTQAPKYIPLSLDIDLEVSDDSENEGLQIIRTSVDFILPLLKTKVVAPSHQTTRLARWF